VPPGYSDEWWAERQSTLFMPHLKSYFIAVQSEIDHVQPDNWHSIQLNNLATHARYSGAGRCLWRRVNSESGWTANPRNSVYSLAAPPQWLAESVSADVAVVQYAQELAAAPARDGRMSLGGGCRVATGSADQRAVPLRIIAPAARTSTSPPLASTGNPLEPPGPQAGLGRKNGCRATR